MDVCTREFTAGVAKEERIGVVEVRRGAEEVRAISGPGTGFVSALVCFLNIAREVFLRCFVLNSRP